jgi:HlyD family secretion protein
VIDYYQAKLDLANKDVERAQSSFNQVKDFAPNDPRYASAYTALYNAKKNVQSAQATLNWFTGQPTEQDIAEADANLALAKAQLDAAQRKVDRMVNGYDPDELTAAQAKVDSAQATVNSMYIIAPFDGEILAVETVPNSVVGNGDAAIVMVNRNTLKVQVTVDETDIARVAIGNKARISMDVLPDITLNGTVVLIDPIGATVNGLVKYTVFVSVESNAQANYFGATTDVTLVTSDPRTMLAVPLGAVQNDTNGEYVLHYKSDGSLERIEVKSDTIMDDKVSITGDLKEGDQVFVGTLSTTSSNSDTQRGPGGMFGMP